MNAVIKSNLTFNTKFLKTDKKMKKNLLSLLVLVFVVSTSCRQEISSSLPTQKYAKAVAGSFVAKDGDITFKAFSPNIARRTWTMYAVNSSFYPGVPIALVNGSEFITSSQAYDFWHNSAHNPETFGSTEAVYSNLTPAEPVRYVAEGKLTDGGEVRYLGMSDFNPTQVNFPLEVKCYRLGDIVKINTDALTSLPGGAGLVISVAYNMKLVDVQATKLQNNVLTGPDSNNPLGSKQLSWGDIKYSTPVQASFPNNTPLAATGVTRGDQVVYDGYLGKVIGLKITIKDGSSTYLCNVTSDNLGGAGQGTLLTLTTTKKGWYDGAIPTSYDDNEITILTTYVTIQ